MSLKAKILRKYRILSAPNTQRELEKLSDAILKALGDRGIQNLHRLSSYTGAKKDHITFFDIGLKVVPYKGPLDNFVQNSGVDISFLHQRSGNTNLGEYNKHNKHLYVYADYTDFFHDKWDDEKQYKNVTRKDVDEFLNHYSETLMHELTHAYDDFISKGNALKKGSRELFKEGGEDAYLRDQPEVNARYQAAVKEISKYKMYPADSPKHGWSRYKTEFMSRFQGWGALTEKQRERLLKRLSLDFHTLSEDEKDQIVENEILSHMWKFAYEGVWQARIDPRIKSEPLKKLAVKNYKNPEFKDAVAEMEKQGRLEDFLKLKDGIRS
jgi:hypothetical protein